MFQISTYEELFNIRVCVPTLEAKTLLHPTSNIHNMMDVMMLCKRDIKLIITL